MSSRRFKPQQGLGAIAAIVVLVILSSIAAGVIKLGWVEQTNFAQDLQGARGSQAAMAGVEWGMFQALKGTWTSCAGASQNIDLISSHGFMVTVTCNSTLYNEGQASDGTTASTVRLYTIEAVACTTSSGTSCPDATRASGVNYVERKRQAQITDH
jgi:MSHA biogenesis protein MshP